MSVSKRIREIRKKLNLNQTEFGEKIGVTRNVIKNIELDTLKNGIPDNIIKLIAVTFNYNEDWIRNGKGNERNEKKLFSFDEFLKEKEATELEIDIMKIYLSLDKNIRRKLMSDFKKAVLKDVKQEAKQKPNIIRVPARGGYYEIEETEESIEALKRDDEKDFEYNPDYF